ncbi:MAG: hypothetical protein IT495_08480 [Gammaproteobacteria bacterium]|nr:hypothetical protein [Gammaproteobacteria bacterium]
MSPQEHTLAPVRTRWDRHPLARRALTGAKIVFTPCALVFLVLVAWRARAPIAAILRDAQTLPLAGAVLLWLLAHLISPLVAALVLRACGATLTYRHALAIHARRLPAKYLPGGVWHTVARGVDYGAAGVAGRVAATGVLIEHLLAVALAAGIGSALALASGQTSVRPVVFAALLITSAAIPLAGWLWLRRRAGCGLRAYWSAVAAAGAFWLIAAGAFHAYVAAFPALVAQAGALQIASAYLLGWATGFVAVFAPQGLGVAEVVAAAMLPTAVGLGAAAALFAGFRIVVLAADLLAWALWRRV